MGWASRQNPKAVSVSDVKQFPVGFEEAAIVGKPIKIVSGFACVVATCMCAGKGVMLFSGLGASIRCPECMQGWRLNSFKHDVDSGVPPNVGLQMIMGSKEDARRARNGDGE